MKDPSFSTMSAERISAAFTAVTQTFSEFYQKPIPLPVFKWRMRYAIKNAKTGKRGEARKQRAAGKFMQYCMAVWSCLIGLAKTVEKEPEAGTCIECARM